MTKLQKADPAARRQAVLLVIVGILVGTVLIVSFQRYRMLLRDWLLSEPEQSAYRLRLVLLLAATLLLAPLFGFAIYLWSLSRKVIGAQQFPPQGSRVIRDTPILEGQAAISRGRIFRVIAVFISVAATILWFLIWRLAEVLVERAG